MKESKKIWEVDEDYRWYITNHYPEAIEFIKKNRKIFNNKWIDIQDYSTFPKTTPKGSLLPGTNKVILFKSIIFDVFDRKIKPEYIKDDYNLNKYITWQTATEDIESQRANGIKGEQWVLECTLDIEKIPCKTKKVLIPESQKLITNPAYTAFLQSDEYLKYKEAQAEYDIKYSRFRAYRKEFHDFTLPDGSKKTVLLYFKPDEKFEMLRELGVPEEEISISKNELVEPIKPIKPVEPSQTVMAPIPAHYVDRQIPAKWVWHHKIKYIGKKK